MSRFWNDDRDAELRRLAKQGCGDPEIAAVLGASCTKNMVIGRRHRLHIELTQCQPGKRRPLMATAGPHKAPKTPKKPKEAPNPNPATTPAPEVAPMIQPALEPVEMLFAPMPKVDAPTGAGAAVLALKHGECKWPIGEVLSESFHFCCGKTFEGRVYCDEHMARASSRPDPEMLARMARIRATRRNNSRAGTPFTSGVVTA
jgi:GcrA cell cycle regulator